MSAEGRLLSVLEGVRELVRSQSDLSVFVGAELEDLNYVPVSARDLPAVAMMMRDGTPTSPETEALTNAIHTASKDIRWAQSYSEAQVGATFLQGYAWFDLVSPDGPFLNNSMRVAVGYWAKGLTYPKHTHEPEEMYCVLAGGGVFSATGRETKDARPGDLIHHPSRMPHAIDMTNSSLLAIAFWRGAGLTDVSSLGDAP